MSRSISRTGTIISREYKARIKSKSFIISTILTPLLMCLVLSIPLWLDRQETVQKQAVRTVAVIDNTSGKAVFKALRSDSLVKYIDCNVPLSMARTVDNTDAILTVDKDALLSPKGNAVALFVSIPSKPEKDVIKIHVSRELSRILLLDKLSKTKIPDVDLVVNTLSDMPSFNPYTESMADEGQTGEMLDPYALSLALSCILYVILLVYSQMVMNSIIEEKNSRVLEVMVCSVRPFEMMMGKIIGIGALALTQIAVWGALLGLACVFMPNTLGIDLPRLVDSINGETVIVAMVVLLLLIGGFFLYAAIAAAIGSLVDNAHDATQLNVFSILPLLAALLITLSLGADIDNAVSFWGAVIPFSSPVMAIPRLLSGDMYTALVSLPILFATFIWAVMLASKIYRAGIFMHGATPSLKMIIKILRQS